MGYTSWGREQDFPAAMLADIPVYEAFVRDVMHALADEVAGHGYRLTQDKCDVSVRRHPDVPGWFTLRIAVNVLPRYPDLN